MVQAMVVAAALATHMKAEAPGPRLEAVHTTCSPLGEDFSEQIGKPRKRAEGSCPPYTDLLYLLAVLLPSTFDHSYSPPGWQHACRVGS